MPDGSDPGRVEKYTDRQVERVRRCVCEPTRSDILKTIRLGRRGNIPSPKPNQRTKPGWSKATIRNNARDLRILAGQLQGLDEEVYEGTTWAGREGGDDYPDRLLDLSPEQVTELIAEMSIERDWARSNERDYCLTVRNHFLAHDKIDEVVPRAECHRIQRDYLRPRNSAESTLAHRPVAELIHFPRRGDAVGQQQFHREYVARVVGNADQQRKPSGAEQPFPLVLPDGEPPTLPSAYP